MASEREIAREARIVLARLRRNGGHLRNSVDVGGRRGGAGRAPLPRRRDGGDEVFLMFSPRNRHARPVMEVPAAVAAAMIAAGWLEERDGRWHLSPLGRKVADGAAPAMLHLSTLGEALRGEETRRIDDAREGARVVRARRAEAPLEWLAKRRDARGRPFLNAVEVEAGEKLREDYERAHLGPRLTMAWDAGMTAGERRRMRGTPRDPAAAGDRTLAARLRLRRALAAAGPGLDEVLLEVVCLARGLEAAERRLGWPRRSARLVLKLALQRLARHYGLIREEAEARAGRILGWGLPDHVPTRALPEDGAT